MLIPSIDLQGGRIVQLVQGERLAIGTDDVDGWVDRFRPFPKVQLIDLDAAKGSGSNDTLIQRICRELPCRVGGGIRTIQRAREVIGAGATHVIIGSALFKNASVDLETAFGFASALGPDSVIGAVDAKHGRVAIHGWRTLIDLTPVRAVAELTHCCGEFLYTHIDCEGLMQGADLTAIQAVRQATSRRLSAAGGITTLEEIEYLDSIGVDAVVGMALYTGRLAI